MKAEVMLRYKYLIFLGISVLFFLLSLQSQMFIIGPCVGEGISKAQYAENNIFGFIEAGPFPDPDAYTLWRAWFLVPFLLASWAMILFKRRIISGLFSLTSLIVLVTYLSVDRYICAAGGDEPGPYFYATVKAYGNGYILLLLAVIFSICSSIYYE